MVAATLEEAHAAVDAMLGDGSMGEAGARVVIEECLVGEEASFIVMCDGRNVLALATSQDHKRLQDGDQGPNTGGMGAYSPAPIVTPELHHRIMREIILPTVQGMTRDGIPYTGFLYAGLMIAPGDDPDRAIKTLEFNCRMGDPETQPIMMRVKATCSTRWSTRWTARSTRPTSPGTAAPRWAWCWPRTLPQHAAHRRRHQGPAGRRRGLHGVPCRHAPGRR